jgi:cyanophycinase
MDAASNSENIDSSVQPPRRRFGSGAGLAIAALIGGLFVNGSSAEDTVPPKKTSVETDQPVVVAKSLVMGSGKLVICGGGVLPIQLRNRFIELAGGPTARVVVITTASAYADTDKMETKLGFWREQKLGNLTILHTRSRQTADEPEFASPLRDATGVWFVGGNQNWLTETYLGTLTEREIRGVLARSGVVGGTSAGAAIMSPVMIRRDRPEIETGPGFGFLPGTVVDQHFLKRHRQGRLLKVLGSHPELVGLGIDEGTGVVVEGNRLSVVGDSQVVVCSPATSDSPESVQSLEAGAEADLGQLRTLMAHVTLKPVAAAAAAAILAPSVDSSTPESASPEAAAQVEAADPVEKVGQ